MEQVLGIIGSPRRNGNTETLVNEVLEGAKEAKANTVKIFLPELKIAPCQACERCKETGYCIQEDDFGRVLLLMKQSQVWVLGTPIYWWGPTAQFKAFMDRWYSADNSTFQNRRIVLVIPFGASETSGAKHIVGMFETALGKKRIFATILAPGTYGHGAIKRRPAILAEAHKVGQEVVRK